MTKEQKSFLQGRVVGACKDMLESLEVYGVEWHYQEESSGCTLIVDNSDELDRVTIHALRYVSYFEGLFDMWRYIGCYSGTEIQFVESVKKGAFDVA